MMIEKTPTEQLARLFGLKALALGWQSHWQWEPEQHYEGDFLVGAWWTVDILPAFAAPAWLGGIFVSDGSGKSADAAKSCRFGFLVSGAEAQQIGHFIISDHDPFAAALKSINLTEDDGAAVLDGIHYHIQVHTHACTVDLHLGNARMPSHKQLEQAMFSLASGIADKSAMPELEEYMATWNEYMNG